MTSREVGEGWWEGVNSSGERGLFPAEYVSPVPEVAMAPVANDWKDPIQTSTQPYPFAPNNNSTVNTANHGTAPNNDQYEGDWADDDWDDDDSQTSEFTTGDVSPATTPHSRIAPILLNPKQPIVKKSINRFSHFVKSGGEDFILGLQNHEVNQHDYIYIVDDNGTFKWSPNYFTYVVSVENPKKESKMRGLKSYIAYQLTPSDTGIPVSRRYKHFDWLHERLQDKYTTIPIPSLPDKQISGRYQEDFIQNRRIQLHSWVNRICRHPVLSNSTVWKHFITCKDEKQWKNGKRRAEKDELVGGLFFLTIQIPENVHFDYRTDQKLEQFSQFVAKMDESIKNAYNVSQDMIKRYQTYYRREFSKIGCIFSSVSEAFNQSPSIDPKSRMLIEAINYTSNTYENIGKMYDQQHWEDFGPLSNLMHEYKGILSAWPEILQVYKGAMNKKKESKKALDENRINEKSLEGINKRADIVTYATLAEMNHFQEERVNDFNIVMRTFLTGQLKLYRDIVGKLEEALEKIPA